ncbi:thiol reductant ABC exporter subunit CydD [Variovorax sp. J22R24]|uniref:thiol reductant ABC exporter subunit CydD n=1 Tax=Variovorax gracilis TaxID=3053502 RepID=UPI002577F8CF|nr:thiol reductant ABC exporter subunit CydD [Variovorax sp. J22R24]MDM0109390.1 thiol reductant ABC exporter subunit CydD [Variovorax sp. J22R24]
MASLVQGLAALLWIPQAALLAWAVQRLGDGEGIAAVLWPAAGILLLGSMRAAWEAWGMRRVYASARLQLSRLREGVAAALAARSPLDSARPASGLAASVIAEQAEAVVPCLVRYGPARWRAMLVPLVIVVAVASLSWVAALVLLIAAPLIPIFMAIIGWRAKAASEAQMNEVGDMNAFLLDRLRGLATLRALGAVDATARRLGEAAQSLRERTMSVLRIAFLSSAVLELFSALGVAMVAAYVGFHLLGTFEFGTWGARLSLGQGMFILLLAPAFFEPLRELSAVWHDRAAGEAALDSLDRLARDGVPLPGAQASASPQGLSVAGAPSVRVHGLHFSHPGEAALFAGSDLRVAPGEHVALMGPSGSGKTALLSLIAGLVPVQQGEIVIGGVPLSERTVVALRGRMAWMGQKPHVFAGSVQANVAMGRAHVRAAQVEAAMQFAALDDVAQAHPSNTLGEGGTGLSGGEAVRLALARLAANPGADLLLVDEPTAHLDTQTAERVADALLELARGRTLIVATHDPVLASRMHRVVRLHAVPEEEAA